MKPVYKTTILKVSETDFVEKEDLIASETAYDLYINGEFFVSLQCSPVELEAMAIGFLLSEGISINRQDLQEITVDSKTTKIDIKISNLPASFKDSFKKQTLTSGCGKGITFTDADGLRQCPFIRTSMKIAPAVILQLLKEFRHKSDLYKNTGGIHSAALAEAGKIVLFAEDIGRHNAVDKLVGMAFLQGLPLTDKILLSSGRISGEIMTKVIRNQIPILVSRTAPTCMSITHAEDYGITLIGFARGKRMNVYSHPQRLILP